MESTQDLARVLAKDMGHRLDDFIILGDSVSQAAPCACMLSVTIEKDGKITGDALACECRYLKVILESFGVVFVGRATLAENFFKAQHNSPGNWSLINVSGTVIQRMNNGQNDRYEKGRTVGGGERT